MTDATVPLWLAVVLTFAAAFVAAAAPVLVLVIYDVFHREGRG